QNTRDLDELGNIATIRNEKEVDSGYRGIVDGGLLDASDEFVQMPNLYNLSSKRVFSKMRNHTVTNRMTSVGNTLRRHYKTYLLEYELALDDVDGECCLLCHRTTSSSFLKFVF
ncbi:ARID/BRIGHT DNA-binding domain-containing protein, partial [Cynara cardunculus var. scolymus]